MTSRRPFTAEQLLALLDATSAPADAGALFAEVTAALVAEAAAHTAAVDAIAWSLAAPPSSDPAVLRARDSDLYTAMLIYRRATVALRVIQDRVPVVDYALALEAYAALADTRTDLPEPHTPRGGGTLH